MSSRFFEEKLVTQDYAKYRPVLPEEIFTTTLEYLKEAQTDGDNSNHLALAIDVGCGTGHQSTATLAKHFEKVLGVDVSKEQINVATTSQHPKNITFLVSEGEAIPAKDNTACLVQASASAHWFNLEKFYEECDRVLKPGGVISIFSYGIGVQVVNHSNHVEINTILDEMCQRPEKRGFYVAGNYLVMGRYTHPSIQIPYENKKRVDNIAPEMSTTVAGFLGFYRNQSPFRRMREAEKDITDKWFDDILDRLLKALGMTDVSSPFTFKYDVFMQLGKKPLK